MAHRESGMSWHRRQASLHAMLSRRCPEFYHFCRAPTRHSAFEDLDVMGGTDLFLKWFRMNHGQVCVHLPRVFIPRAAMAARVGLMFSARPRLTVFAKNPPLQLFAFETGKKFLTPDPGEQPKIPLPPSLVAGAMAGVCSTMCTYPLELLKTRLTIEVLSLEQDRTRPSARFIYEMYARKTMLWGFCCRETSMTIFCTHSSKL